MSETNVTGASESPKEPKKGWDDWVTRMAGILAVLAALSSGRWGASNLQAILEQGRVNDAWAYYQSKSIKEHAAQQTHDLVKALAADPQGANHAAMIELQQRMKAEAEREGSEKAQREADARRFQERRDELVEKSFWFEISFACLQLGVILCTIAAGSKRKLPFNIGIAVGLAGLVLLANGFHPLVHARRSWYGATSDAMDYQVAPKTVPATSK